MSDNSHGIGKDSSDNNKFAETKISNSVSLLRYSRARAANVKRVKFLKNGDKFFGGITFTISPHKHRTLDALMNELTEIIPLPLGVRSILTPKGGSRIESIDQLENGKTYVCSSRQSLKKMDYTKVKSPTWLPGSKRVPAERRSHPVLVRRNSCGSDSIKSTSSQWQTPISLAKAKVITVIRNGPPPRQKTKILVNQRSTPSWEHLFQSISDLFQLRSNPVQRLFMMNGIEVRLHSISCMCVGRARAKFSAVLFNIAFII